MLVGFQGESIFLMLCDGEVQGAFNGPGFGSGIQRSLDSFDFGGVQSKMLICISSSQMANQGLLLLDCNVPLAKLQAGSFR